jgi:site-specific DNA-methyltransferase (adenine-specific)
VRSLYKEKQWLDWPERLDKPSVTNHTQNHGAIMQPARTLDTRPKIRKPKKVATIAPETSQENNHLKEILNTFVTGDAVAEMSRMPAECIDLAITSPPYDDLRDYKGYSFKFEKIAAALFRVLKPGGVLVWVVGDKINGGRSLTSFRQGIYFQEIGFTMHDIMIYRKKNTPFMRSNAYTNAFEFMFVLTKGKPTTFNPLKEKTVRNGPEMLVHNKKADGINKKVLKDLKKEKTKTNIWSYAVGLGGTTSDKIAFEHPAVFPEQLAMDHILSWTNEGDTVLDPMCGSGTSCKMARKTDRNYIGIDISPEYIEIARKRMRKLENEQMVCLFN